MDKYIIDYLDFFIQKSVRVNDEVKKCVEYWSPDLPPMILLFSQVGKALAAQLNSISKSERLVIFQHIETGMCSKEDELATAVATGLVESLVTASDENVELWTEIESCLQPESKKHALAWKNFGQ